MEACYDLGVESKEIVDYSDSSNIYTRLDENQKKLEQIIANKNAIVNTIKDSHNINKNPERINNTPSEIEDVTTYISLIFRAAGFFVACGLITSFIFGSATWPALIVGLSALIFCPLSIFADLKAKFTSAPHIPTIVPERHISYDVPQESLAVLATIQEKSDFIRSRTSNSVALNYISVIIDKDIPKLITHYKNIPEEHRNSEKLNVSGKSPNTMLKESLLAILSHISNLEDDVIEDRIDQLDIQARYLTSKYGNNDIDS